MTMINAYATHEAGAPLQAYQYDPGELQPNEVEINVLHCGICHSDLSVMDNEWGNAQYPVVPGHEVVGTVGQIGSHVTNLKVGQAVGLGWHAGYCDSCSLCQNGDQNLCARKQPTIIGHHGGFADKVRAKATSVVAIPDGMDLESAGPLFCGGITVFNPLVQYDIKPTARVAVIGIGGLGHIALQFLNAWGSEVTAFTSSESKKTEVLEIGAHHALNSRDPDELKAAYGRFDLIISTVNVQLDWNRYLSTLAPKGRLHFVGATTEPLGINVPLMLFNQLEVSASPVGSPAVIAQMLQFAKQHDIKPIIEQYSFDNINDAVERLRSGKARYRVVLSHS